MKSVLRSIKPYYLYLIIMGRKTVELGKDFPVSPEWDRKVELYCSKDKKSFKRIPEADREWMRKYIGKVACRFVCDKIDKMLPDYNPITKQFFYNNNWESNDWNSNDTCLSTEELNVYGKRKPLYGWHISDLKIHDTPKELGEFFVKGECENFDFCRFCSNFHEGRGWLDGSTCDEDDCITFGIKPIRRPPQSWQYMETV